MDFIELISAYPQKTQEDACSVRDFLLRTFPELSEQLDPVSHLTAYSLGVGMKGIVFTLLLSRTGVKIGLNRGSELPDPSRLLEGTGKVHKYIRFIDHQLLGKTEFQQLLTSAIEAARSRLKVSTNE
jgi:hypothetical protein